MSLLPLLLLLLLVLRVLILRPLPGSWNKPAGAKVLSLG
jgi:hypothetical protein